MKVSLIIPTLRVGDLLEKCIKSFEGDYDELIVIDDTDLSLAKKINKGLKQASGDFLVVSNDDVEKHEGSLRELCVEGEVISPRIRGHYHKTFHAHMFCLSRDIYEKVGGYSEDYEGVYYIDSDYWMKLKEAGFSPILAEDVYIYHNHPASTIKTLDSKQQDMGSARKWFISKWGSDCLPEVE